jgi:hypothetical protein
MQNHIKMTKSFLQLLTKLESSIDTSNSSEKVRVIGEEGGGGSGGDRGGSDRGGSDREGCGSGGDRGGGDREGCGSSGDREGCGRSGDCDGSGCGDSECTGSEVKGSLNISCSDIDNIYIQLTHKDDLISKLKEIIVCKNDKITKLIKDINEVKKRNDYLEAKIIELTKTINLLHKNIDRNTLIIDLP